MTTIELAHVDIELGNYSRSVTGSYVTEESLCFSDTEEGSTCSGFYSANGGSFDDYSFACVTGSDCAGARGTESRRSSSVKVEEVVSVPEVKVHLGKVERDCRICHLSLDSPNNECGLAIELGCSCKDDLAAAHKQCAQIWFKIKGNKTCEICSTLARNVAGANEVELTEPSNENNYMVMFTESPAPLPTSEVRRLWNGHRIVNFLLACMVLAFVISWLFHFKVPS